MKSNNRLNRRWSQANAVIKTLVVTDYSVFNLFKSKSKIKNRDLIFKNMEIYYTHLFNKVKSKDFILNYLKFILII